MTPTTNGRNLRIVVGVVLMMTTSFIGYSLLISPAWQTHHSAPSTSVASIAPCPACKCPPVWDIKATNATNTTNDTHVQVKGDNNGIIGNQYRWYPGMKEKHRRYAAVIVESRPVDRLVRVILQFMSVLDEDWEFQVYHSPRNERMLRDSSSLQWAMAQGRLKLYHIDRDQFDQNWYNSLFMNNRTFWEHISSELILIFQVDAVLCNRSPTTIKDYLQFDYIGGAWGGAHSFGGNGGLSLRRRAKVLECVSPYAGGQMEDTHFAFCMNARGHRVARQADSIPFSVETVFYGTPWGIHNAWMYLGEPQIAALRAYCPEVEDPIWFQYNEK